MLGGPEKRKKGIFHRDFENPSNTETMKELVKIYEAEGDEEKAEKYRKKISIVAENVEKDRLLAMEEKR